MKQKGSSQNSPTRPQSPTSALREMNDKYFVAKDGEHILVFQVRDDENSVSAWPRRALQAYTIDAFCNWERNKWVADGPLLVKRGDWWLNHPERREYGRIRFSPSQRPDAGIYELWRGYSVPPSKGYWSPFREIMVQVICGGNESAFEWLFRWMARAIQKPAEQGQVAIILRGGEKTCARSFATIFGELFGQHFVVVEDSRRLSHQFNNQLRDAALMYVDGAVWPCDRGAAGLLNRLVVDATLPIETKGVSVVNAPNHLSIIASTDRGWVVPAGLPTSRYFILDLSDDTAIPEDRLNRISLHMREGGGQSALLYDLLNFDNAEFNFRRAEGVSPEIDQVIQNMPAIDRWWFECLLHARIVGSGEGSPLEGRPWPSEGEPLSRDELYEAFQGYSEKIFSMRRRLPKAALWARIKSKLLCRLVDPKTTIHAGKRLWIFPSLHEARHGFEQAYSREFFWDKRN